MIIENKENISQYFFEDDKGKLIPQYLVSYTSKLQNNYNLIQNEIRNLMKHFEHIKAITEMQKSLSGVTGLIEKVYVPEMIDTALKMCGASLEAKHISLSKNFKDIKFIVTDKTKLLQILVNLFQNARDALILYDLASVKNITVSLEKIDENNIQIQIKDNGIGIEAENIIKIFSFGFTTKKLGHGFGLHSSALAAKEIGGKLEVTSDGYGQGATFYLTLPLSASKRRSNHERKSELTSHRD
jgi:signal transduction histidine kinase